MKGIMALMAGFIFAIGLGIGGMTQPHIVRGFLDILGEWDPRLIFVMAGAVVTHAIFYRLIMKRSFPILDTKFYIPTKKDLDWKLILGAVIFGIGWGWGGICPGPGIVALAFFKEAFLYFVASMLLGMKIFQFVDKKFLSKN